MHSNAVILVADDLKGQRELIAKCCREWGHDAIDVPDGNHAMTVLQTTAVDMVITDVKMPGISGLELLPFIQEHCPGVPVLLVTAYPDVRQAINAVKDGVVDYLVKPVDLDELKDLIENALGTGSRPARELPPLPADVVFNNRRMIRLLEDASLVADSDATILILGESGTGKEVLFDLIYSWSSRSAGPAVKLNCAAIPENIIESEIFGHEKGAFTGAVSARMGRWHAADGGTLMLDEIAELPLPLQAKLLRALQDGSYSPLGCDKTLYADVRVVAATNKDLEKRVKEGKFREDLYYRLNVIEFLVPPLRDRKEDILPLATRFLRELLGKTARIGSGTERVLLEYPWPGNVRELRNVMERGSLMAQGDILLAEHLPARVVKHVSASEQDSSALPDAPAQTLAESEQQLILAALARCNGNRTQTAKELGIGRRTLIYKLKSYERDT